MWATSSTIFLILEDSLLYQRGMVFPEVICNHRKLKWKVTFRTNRESCWEYLLSRKQEKKKMTNKKLDGEIFKQVD